MARLGVMQAPESTAADDRFPRADVAELTIGSATERALTGTGAGRLLGQERDRSSLTPGAIGTAT